METRENPTAIKIINQIDKSKNYKNKNINKSYKKELNI